MVTYPSTRSTSPPPSLELCDHFTFAKAHGWGQPTRRTALGLGAEVKITSVSFGSALPAEDDATASTDRCSKLLSVL